MRKQKSKSIIIKKCGLDKEEILPKLAFAKKNGMKYKRFLLNRAWELSNDEIIKLNNKINKYMANECEKLYLIKNETKVLKEVIVARKFLVNKYGITDKTYYSRKIYLMKEKLFERYIDALKKISENKKEEKIFYSKICKIRTGWTQERVLEEMEKAEKIGINYSYYVRKGAYKMTDAELADLSKFVKKDKQRIKKAGNEYFNKICKATGWSVTKAEFKTRIAKSKSGCSNEDFWGFKFYKKSPEKQATYATLKSFDKLRATYNEYYSTRDNFDVKSTFNKVFKDYIKRCWFTNDELTYEKFKTNIKGLNKIIVKPLSSSCGVGIKCFECNVSEEKDKKNYEFIMSMGKAIIEEYIVQSKEFSEFCPTSVNTVRVTTIVNNGKCELVSSFFRIGTGDVVDNFHANGIAANIDVKTGIVDTHAVDLNNNIYKRSPMTNKKIKGFQIPHWDKIVKLCNEIAFVVKDSKLIGWDFAIMENDIDLIEGNTGAYYVAQLVKATQNKGLKKDMIDRYL